MDIGKQKIFNPFFAEQGMSDVLLWDVQKIKNNQCIKIKFQKREYAARQGIRLQTDKGILIPELGEKIYKSIVLWEDTSPEEIICKCLTSDENLSLYNVWDEGFGQESQLDASGMLVEQIDKKLEYKCNNYDSTGSFSDLSFSLEKL